MFTVKESPSEILAYFFRAGSVDAFAVALGERASDREDLTEGGIILFDVVNVNIRGGYNSTTGKQGNQMVNAKRFFNQQECIPVGWVPPAIVVIPVGESLPREVSAYREGCLPPRRCLPRGCLPRGCLPRGCLPPGGVCLGVGCLPVTCDARREATPQTE